jgi:hypothetical protein
MKISISIHRRATLPLSIASYGVDLLHMVKSNTITRSNHGEEVAIVG